MNEVVRGCEVFFGGPNYFFNIHYKRLLNHYQKRAD